MIFYLDLRYRNIVGHVGLLRFLPPFEQFRDAIQRFCQKDRWYHDHQGNATFIPGLDSSPYNILVGSMTRSIESKYPILVRMEITRELPVKLSTLTLKSQCTPDGRSYTE